MQVTSIKVTNQVVSVIIKLNKRNFQNTDKVKNIRNTLFRISDVQEIIIITLEIYLSLYRRSVKCFKCCYIKYTFNKISVTKH